MGNTVTVVKGGVTEVFENVLGHQIGNGAIQVMERNGNNTIIGGFDDIRIVLDEEAADKFASDLEKMENPPEEVEDCDEASGDNVKRIH